jgi:hypothetical protein
MHPEEEAAVHSPEEAEVRSREAAGNSQEAADSRPAVAEDCWQWHCR